MRRISLILTLALFTPACDSPDQEATKEGVFVKLTAETAELQSEDGETIKSMPREDLVMDDVEFRKNEAAGCKDCKECTDYGGGTVICTGCVDVPCT